MTKKTALLVCPGRGTYNKTELGYITQHFKDTRLLAKFDAVRTRQALPTVSELDQQAVFSRTLHLKAENAAALIFAAGINDYQCIDPEQFDVVAITGNSMGWYTALGCAGVLSPEKGMQLVSDMALLTADGAGAQFIYPVVDDNWQPDSKRQALVDAQLKRHHGKLFMSIVYGGYAVIAGTTDAVKAAMAELPPCDDRFPLLLPGHAAFHTELMQQASDKALTMWSHSEFCSPQVPLIDGRGHIWPTLGADLKQLQQYTLHHQVCQAYDFSLALQVAVKEFAPDHIILCGPGMSLGGAVAQSLISIGWHGLANKQDFTLSQQQQEPYVLSMGDPVQRAVCVSTE